MSWKPAIAGSLAAAFIVAAVPCSAAEDVVIKVWSRADRSGPKYVADDGRVQMRFRHRVSRRAECRQDFEL